MLSLLALFAALAAPPDDVRPVLAPSDVQAQYAEHRRREGRPAALLACEPLWDGALSLCYRRDGGRGAWVEVAALGGWGVDAAGLRAWAIDRGRAALGPWEPRTVEGVAGRYQQAPADRGWAAVALIAPELVVAAVGDPSPLCAAPADGVVLAWAPGRAELDRVIAVGVHKLYEQDPWPATPVVHRWAGDRWVAFAEARPATP